MTHDLENSSDDSNESEIELIVAGKFIRYFFLSIHLKISSIS